MPIITLRESDWYGTQWICDTNLWPDIYRDGYKGVAWDSHEFKVIHVNKIRGNHNQSTVGMIPVGQGSVVLLV